MEDSNPALNKAAALDSVLFSRDPFPVINGSDLLNIGSDRNTRVIVFVLNLQAPSAASVLVSLIDGNNQSFIVVAEDVRTLPNFAFTQVVFRLPDNLAVGNCSVQIIAPGQLSNVGVITIRN
jgi:hypothetical protein